MKIIKLPKWFNACFVIGPFIFKSYQEELDSCDINYFKIIGLQQRELLILGWPVVLIIDLISRMISRCLFNDLSVVIENCFRQEARTYMNNLAYTQFRPFFNWLNYFAK